MTNRLRSEGTKALMTAAREAGARRVVAQSASFMTQPVGSDPTDESSPLYLDAPEPIRSHIQANIAAETLVWAHRGSKASSFATAFSSVKALRSGRVENG